MLYLISYYVIGVLVSLYFINYYRLSDKTKSKPSKNDALLALIGPWLFPLQIILHFFTRKKRYKKSKFSFLLDDGTKKEPKEGELYFNDEWVAKLKFPFLRKKTICYILKNNKWKMNEND